MSDDKLKELAYELAGSTTTNVHRERTNRPLYHAALAALTQARDLGRKERDAEWKSAASVVADTDLLGPGPIIEHVERRGREEERKALREIVLSDTCMPNCFHDECARSRSIFTRIAALDEEPA